MKDVNSPRIISVAYTAREAHGTWDRSINRDKGFHSQPYIIAINRKVSRSGIRVMFSHRCRRLGLGKLISGVTAAWLWCSRVGNKPQERRKTVSAPKLGSTRYRLGQCKPLRVGRKSPARMGLRLSSSHEVEAAEERAVDVLKLGFINILQEKYDVIACNVAAMSLACFGDPFGPVFQGFSA